MSELEGRLISSLKSLTKKQHEIDDADGALFSFSTKKKSRIWLKTNLGEEETKRGK